MFRLTKEKSPKHRHESELFSIYFSAIGVVVVVSAVCVVTVVSVVCIGFVRDYNYHNVRSSRKTIVFNTSLGMRSIRSKISAKSFEPVICEGNFHCFVDNFQNFV